MKCSGCGHENRDAAKFCDGCARPVAGAPQPRAADPRSFTPKRLTEKMQSTSALECERKYVTVLFADVSHIRDGSAPLEYWAATGHRVHTTIRPSRPRIDCDSIG